jgi:hypothetical protein
LTFEPICSASGLFFSPIWNDVIMTVEWDCWYWPLLLLWFLWQQ